MFKCNVCGAIFDKPLEQHREVEYYSRPFGNESEPYGGGYYDCCPECESEDFERYSEQDYIEDLENKVEILEKALELACVKLLSIYCSDYCGETSNCEKINCEYAKKSSPEYFKTKAREIMKSE